MNDFWPDGTLFLDASFAPSGAMCLVSTDEEHARTKVPATRVDLEVNGQWRRGPDANWDVVSAVRCTAPIAQHAIVGVYGDVRFIGSGDVHDELIRDGAHSPESDGLLRDARVIGGLVHACGMNRQVYRRVERDRWTSLFQVPDERREVAGFEAIDGYGADEIYAAGWNGEIWEFDGRRWHARETGTNLTVVDVCCAGDGTVYALCHGRTLLAGRHDQWRIVPLDLPVDLWSLAWYGEALHACSMRDPFVFREGGFVPMPAAPERPETLQTLRVSPHGLVTIGPRHVCRYDGNAWTRLA